MEQAALGQLLARRELMVLATGGGIVSEPVTFDLILSSFYTVWLKAEPEEHMMRVRRQGEILRAELSEALGRFFDLPVMILFGAAIPWRDWIGLGWRGVAFAAGILLLRRIPAWLLLGWLMPWTRPVRNAVFAGWFGPIGAAALYYAMLIHDQTGSARFWPAGTPPPAASFARHHRRGSISRTGTARPPCPRRGLRIDPFPSCSASMPCTATPSCWGRRFSRTTWAWAQPTIRI